MKTGLKTAMFLMAALVLAASLCYAEGREGSAVVNGITNILKAPVTLLQKAGDSMQDSRPAAGGEGVEVAPIYDLNAETTG